METIHHIFDDITALDTALFWILHMQLRTPFLDGFIPCFSNPFPYYREAAFSILLIILIFWGKRVWFALILVGISVMTTDIICSHVLKDTIQRLRPYELLGYGTTGEFTSYSFPSAHAANMFAMATTVFYLNRKVSIIFIFLAVMVSYSRIYTGSHYPFDVLGGMVTGICVTGIIILIERYLRKRFAGEVKQDITCRNT